MIEKSDEKNQIMALESSYGLGTTNLELQCLEGPMPTGTSPTPPRS